MEEVGHPSVEDRERRHADCEENQGADSAHKSPEHGDTRHPDRRRDGQDQHDHKQNSRRLRDGKFRLQRNEHVHDVGVELDARHRYAVSSRCQELVVHAREPISADQHDLALHPVGRESVVVDVAEREVLAVLLEAARTNDVVDHGRTCRVDLKRVLPRGAEVRLAA